MQGLRSAESVCLQTSTSAPATELVQTVFPLFDMSASLGGGGTQLKVFVFRSARVKLLLSACQDGP